jgi:class III cytochrome C family protein
VHLKVIKGELWEKQAHLLPACVDCHQPHKIRSVFYDQGTADTQCLECHQKPNLRARDGRSVHVNYQELGHSKHVSVSCSQCHSGVNISHTRPCDAIEKRVDCSACHTETANMFNESIHGIELAKNDPDAPKCIDCHGTHGVLGKNNPNSRTFPTRVPTLCGECHRAGEKGAVRTDDQEDVVGHYIESIHGKGLLQSGLVVTAQCTDCHTAHAVQPLKDPRSSIHNDNVASTCGTCHHGIEEQFAKSIHSQLVSDTDKELPTCNDCHSAHTIRRADESGFMLEIMTQCGRCHEKIADTYFDTYHGKVSQLGYTKTAKCYDCHGAHDILPVSDPKSHLSRENVVETCKSCHPAANRQFAGYLTHATHHDPDKYPYLFWAFWGMTTLLIFTFVLGFTHTLLWLPRAIQWRKELKRLEAEEEAKEQEEHSGAIHDNKDPSDDRKEVV